MPALKIQFQNSIQDCDKVESNSSSVYISSENLINNKMDLGGMQRKGKEEKIFRVTTTLCCLLLLKNFYHSTQLRPSAPAYPDS